MFNDKEENVLIQTLVKRIIELNEEIDDLEETIEITMSRLRELRSENDKLKNRLNLIYSKKDSPIPF